MLEISIPAEYEADDILHGELSMLQPPEGHGPRVNVDTVLLAHYVRFPARAKIMEMGCAHGAISLLLARRRERAWPDADTPVIDAIDINEELIAAARVNASRNGLDRQVSFSVRDLRDYKKFSHSEHYDVVVMNPPYDEPGRSRTSAHTAMNDAMHGASCTLEEVVRCAKYLLKNGGRLYLVVRAKRTAELFALLCAHNVKPKRMRAVHPKDAREASVVLVEAVRASGDGIVVEPPLFILGADGNYTPELLDAYRPC